MSDGGECVGMWWVEGRERRGVDGETQREGSSEALALVPIGTTFHCYLVCESERLYRLFQLTELWQRGQCHSTVLNAG